MCRWKALPWLNADESEEWLSRIHRLVRICTQSKHINAIKSLWSDVPDKVKVENLNVLSDIFQSRPTPHYMYTTTKGYLIAYLHAEELTRAQEPFRY